MKWLGNRCEEGGCQLQGKYKYCHSILLVVLQSWVSQFPVYFLGMNCGGNLGGHGGGCNKSTWEDVFTMSSLQ